jgi:hypothetical protein
LAAPATTEDFRLGVNWAGMHVADVTLASQPEGDLIGASMEISTRGMASMLTSYTGELRSICRDVDGKLISVHHKAALSSRRYTRDIEISYDSEGNPTNIVVLKRGEPQKVTIPRDMWQNTVDPLTGILRVRRWMVAPNRPDHTVVPIFDGRSRYDIILGAMPAKGSTARARMEIQALATTSRSSWLQDWGDDNGRWIEAQVSDDERAVPILLETRNGRPSSSIELDRDCSNGAACS